MSWKAIRHQGASCVFIDVSDECAVSIFREEEQRCSCKDLPNVNSSAFVTMIKTNNNRMDKAM
jgi:hypothetical protein